jgi:hypothetical protein
MEYRNPQMLENGWIDCEIEHPEYGWIPFTCDPNDTGAQFDTAELHARMQADLALLPYIPPTQEELDAQAAGAIRYERNLLLQNEIDPIAGNALRWAALTAEQQQAWADYRQALLDVPQQAGFPHDVTWPTKPE